MTHKERNNKKENETNLVQFNNSKIDAGPIDDRIMTNGKSKEPNPSRHSNFGGSLCHQG